jgi:hypothetical protein
LIVRDASRRSASAEPGFGLVELMITLTLTAVVLGAIYGAFFRTQRAAQGVMREVDARQGARSAVQLLERDIRMAGSGWGRLMVEGAYGGDTLSLQAVNPGPGGDSDSLSVLGGWDIATTLRASMTDESTVIKCVSTSGFAVGDLVVVTNGESAHLFQVTSLSASPADLQHATSSTFNAAGGHVGFPTGGYGIGSRVFKTGWVSYGVDSTTYIRPALVRREVGRASQLVAHDIEAFHVWYRLADGTETRAPANLTLLQQVVPVIHPRGTAAGQADSAKAVIRPRTF